MKKLRGYMYIIAAVRPPEPVDLIMFLIKHSAVMISSAGVDSLTCLTCF